MNITKEELRVLNKWGSVAIWRNKPTGAEHYELLAVKE